MFKYGNAKFALSMHDKWITRTVQHNALQYRVKVPFQDYKYYHKFYSAILRQSAWLL